MTTSITSDAYAEWLEELTSEGLEPWLLTFMFHQLPGSPTAKIQQMFRCVELAYGIRITRVIKHPLARRNRLKRPIWLAAADLPIFKQIKQKLQLRLVLPNDGLHVHIIVLETIIRECEECIAEDMWARKKLYCRRCPGLAHIDVRAITYDMPEVTSYLLKQVEKKITADDVLILPKTNDELRRSCAKVGRNSSIFTPTV